MAVQITQQGLGLMPWLFSADALNKIANENLLYYGYTKGFADPIY